MRPDQVPRFLFFVSKKLRMGGILDGVYMHLVADENSFHQGL